MSRTHRQRAVNTVLALLTGIGLSLALGTPVTARPGPVAGQASPALGFSGATTDYRPVIKQLREEIRAAMRKTHAVGLMITLVDGDRTVMSEGFGYADEAAHRRVTADTLFHIGSVSKTFASLAVMQLVERGLVDLDAPLAKYVPEFTMKGLDPANPITVREVLDHHSGIPGDLFNGMITVGSPDRGYHKWLLRTLARTYPERPVNEAFSYNNAGFALLDLLVRNVSGLALDDYARKYLFAPMAMSHSTFDDREPGRSRIARNYVLRRDKAGLPVGVTAKQREYVNAWAAGSIMSSAKDMSRYLKTLLAGGQGSAGTVVPPETLQRMWTVQTMPAFDQLYAHYGIGFAIGDETFNAVGPVVWHDGGTVYNFSLLKLLPSSGLGVFVSVNTVGTGLNYEVGNRALSLAYEAKTGKAVAPPPELPSSTQIGVPAAELTGEAGLYAGSAVLYRVEGGAGSLKVTSHLATPEQVTRQYFSHSDGWYRAADGATQLQFQDIAGRHLLVGRMAIGGGEQQIILGARVTPGVPGSWVDRMGDYRVVNRRPGSVLTDAAIRLDQVDGVAVIHLADGPFALQLGPEGALCTTGVGATARGLGHCLTPSTGPNGAQQFVFRGVTYRKVV